MNHVRRLSSLGGFDILAVPLQNVWSIIWIMIGLTNNRSGLYLEIKEKFCLNHVLQDLQLVFNKIYIFKYKFDI